MNIEQLNAAFHPRSIAVVGAFRNPMSMGSRYVGHLASYGYRGQVYPITPHYAEVLGFNTYPTFNDVPDSVDYVICCLPASEVSSLLQDCSKKGVKVVHLYTGRFSETGWEAATEMERKLLQQARELGIRLIGPNCLGIYCPKEGIAFAYDFPKEAGKLGMLLQSGGTSVEFIHYASLRGIRFSKVVSYGNALDFNESDFIEYLTQDPETEIIAGYIEGTKDGRRFLNSLTRAALAKPVVILKAGIGSAGIKAAASHTAALSGSRRIWEAALKQAGAIQARTLEELLDLVVSFYFLPPIKGTRVGIAGGGGGKSVLSADEWEEAGFSIVPLSPEIKDEITRVLPEMWWHWMGNPIDISIFPREAFRAELYHNILSMMIQTPYFDLVIINITASGPFSTKEAIINVKRQVEDIIDIQKRQTKPLAVVLNTGTLDAKDFNDLRWKCLAQAKARLLTAGIAVYSTTAQAASAVSRLINYYQRRYANPRLSDGQEATSRP